MDEAIINHMKRTYNLTIGEQTAERIKIEIGMAAPVGSPVSVSKYSSIGSSPGPVGRNAKTVANRPTATLPITIQMLVTTRPAVITAIAVRTTSWASGLRSGPTTRSAASRSSEATIS